MTKVSSTSSPDAWRTAMRLPWADRFLFVEAMLRLFFARVLVVALPFRILSRRLSAHMRESTSVHDAAHEPLLRRVRWAIAAASRRAPWRCKCLEQGVAAKMMLRKRGVANTLYMGLARADAAVEAHAWLRSGATYVTGGAGRERFTVVSTFADESVRAQ